MGFQMNLDKLQSMTTLLDHLDVGISIFDPQGTVLYVNHACLRMSGRSRSDYIGQTIFELSRKKFFDRPVITEVIHTNKPITRVQRTTTKSGDIKEFLVRANPIFDGNGAFRLIITERLEMRRLMDQYESFRHTFYDEISSSEEIEDAPIICRSQAMTKVMSLADRASQRDSSVLLQGKTGTGKEVVAEYIHNHSNRQNRTMVRINCASMPENLLESELFGYERGAFTGALQTGKPGLIEAADKGTLFLDEVNSMPLSIQAKLLRVLETKSVLRIGARTPKTIDFRLIVAANADLKSCVENGAFREDLYYRLNVIPITIPPLKERREDIRPLANHFLRRFCSQYGLEKRLLPKIYRLMQSYDWPGNVRELRNFIEWIVVMSTTETVKISDIPTGFLNSVNANLSQPKATCLPPDERTVIVEALEKFQYRRQDTADYLGISRRTLQYKLKKYGLLSSHNAQ